MVFYETKISIKVFVLQCLLFAVAAQEYIKLPIKLSGFLNK